MSYFHIFKSFIHPILTHVSLSSLQLQALRRLLFDFPARAGARGYVAGSITFNAFRDPNPEVALVGWQAPLLCDIGVVDAVRGGLEARAASAGGAGF